jgi:hypothetical protein
MTTSSPPSSNKTALRASLKKEDDSLADRLAGTDAPIGATNQTDVSDLDLPTSALPPLLLPLPALRRGRLQHHGRRR